MEIRIIGVVGAGQMGNGIAHVSAQAGFSVVMCDIDEKFVQKGLATIDKNRVRAIALSLRTDYPQLQIFARTETLREGAYLREHGIHNAGTMYIESTLFRGGQLLKVLGVPEEQAGELIEDMRRDDFRLLKKAFSVAD